MKKILLCLGSLALAACASNAPHSSSGLSSNATLGEASATETYVHERNPADSDPTVQWVPTDLALRILPNSTQATADVTVNQQMSWTKSEPYTDSCSRYDIVDVATTCTDLRCNGGAGKSEAWRKFYEGPGPEKAKALADAIKGIGIPAAQALIAGGYFHSKPHSWDEFMAELNRAAASKVIDRGVPVEVANSALENAANLGYDQTSCQVTTRACTAPVRQLVSYPCTKMHEVAHSKVSNSVVVHVNMRISGAKLLANEVDFLHFGIDQTGKVVSADTNGEFNHYSVTQDNDGRGNLTINITQNSRILRDLPSNVVQSDSFALVGAQPTFILNVDPSFIPDAQDPNSQLVLDYVVEVCEYGWTGTCGFSSWKQLKLGSQQIKEARTIIPIELVKKNKGQLKYTVTRISSQYFSSKPTAPRSTSNVKMPK